MRRVPRGEANGSDREITGVKNAARSTGDESGSDQRTAGVKCAPRL